MPPKIDITFGQKYCPMCEKDLPIGLFGKDKRATTGLNTYCKKCRVEDLNRWRKNNPAKDRELKRRVKLASAYKMTPEDYESRLQLQSGKCAICKGGPEPRVNFDVDHNHATGHIRGLLCRRCNLALGLFGDDTTAAKRLIGYLSGLLVVDTAAVAAVRLDDSERRGHLKSRYGISDIDYNRAWLAQSGKCLICAKKCASANLLCVDHDHETGKVRGLLCKKCNVAISLLRDSQDIFESLQAYLQASLTK